MSGMTARLAYSWFPAVAVIRARLGGRLGLKLFLQQPEDDLGGKR